MSFINVFNNILNATRNGISPNKDCLAERHIAKQSPPESNHFCLNLIF